MPDITVLKRMNASAIATFFHPRSFSRDANKNCESGAAIVAPKEVKVKFRPEECMVKVEVRVVTQLRRSIKKGMREKPVDVEEEAENEVI